jgi:hypothetical protein
MTVLYMLSVTNEPIMLSVITLNAVVLSVVVPSELLQSNALHAKLASLSKMLRNSAK